MSTILFNQIVFGPIKSRRLGVSLGVNLLPKNGKWCNFDCVYCECGYNKDGKEDTLLPTADDVVKAIEEKLSNHIISMGDIDSITFSGNGEPTMHPHFSFIIDKTLELRDIYAPSAKISVLTNGSGIGKSSVATALLKVDNSIIKIDSAIESTVQLINTPTYNYSISKLLEYLVPFSGKFVLQTMFLKGVSEQGVIIDNTTQSELDAWYDVVEKSNPREIMIYTIDRETPLKSLQKVTYAEMERIAAPLKARGIAISISA